MARLASRIISSGRLGAKRSGASTRAGAQSAHLHGRVVLLLNLKRECGRAAHLLGQLDLQGGGEDNTQSAREAHALPRAKEATDCGS